jgi:hypothetical protein
VGLPLLVIAGVESAGKSSLIEGILKFPVAYKSANTGTRCPVLYTLRNDVNASKPVVTVNGSSVEAAKLAAVVQKHMHFVEKNTASGFTGTPLVIEIISAHVPDLLFVDLPGMLTNPSEEDAEAAASIRTIQANYVRDPRSAVIAVVKCTERFKTVSDFAFMDAVAKDEGLGEFPPRLDWRETALVVANRVNQVSADWTVKAANDYFREARAHGGSVFLVNLQPQRDVASANFDERSAQLHRLQESEAKWWEGLKAQCASQSRSGETWDTRNDEMTGLSNVVNGITKMWRVHFVQSLPGLRQEVARRFQITKARQESLVEELASGNITVFRGRLNEFAIDLTHQYQALINGETVKDIHGRDITSFRMEHVHAYEPKKYGKTFEEELSQYSVDVALCPWLLSYDQLIAEPLLGAHDQFLGKELKMLYLGMASFERSLQVLEFQMLARSFEHVSDDSIMIAARGLSRKGARAFPAVDVVMQLATDQILSLSHGVEWFLGFLQEIFAGYVHPVVDYMTSGNVSRHAYVGRITPFVHMVQNTLKETIAARLKVVSETWQSDVSRFTKYRPVDMISKLTMASVALPLEVVTPKKDMVLPSRPQKSASNSSVREQGLYGIHGQDPRWDEPPPDRELAKLKAMDEIAQEGQTRAKTFNLADLVEGGFTLVYPMEWSMVQFNYLRHVAYSYYVRIVMILAELLRATLHAQFVDFMRDESEKTLLKKIVAMVMNMDDATIARMNGIDPAKVQLELDKVTKEIGELEEIIFNIDTMKSRVMA